ncbi:MAG: DNA (cytosine-5-)-methyltransferase [Gaiellaceae bacterium MAG52_C11]|nr:DNA (cytosine-5-)-methyltransferase [Candidatus Gaiellasilicea maunaloa]
MNAPDLGVVFDHAAGKLSALDREVVEAVPPGGNWRDLPLTFDSQRIAQIRASADRGEGSRSTYYGRLRWDRPSYTISTYFNRPGNGCFIHPTAPRLISVREAARLQGFPDWWRFAGRGRARFVQVGNAVPPLLAYQLARVYEPGPVVDLFSGAGGFAAGFQWAGFPLVAAADHDRAANEVLARNLDGEADNVVAADLSDSDQLRAVVEHVRTRLGGGGLRALVGGPPCQGFSTAGNCRPDDPRNRLVFAFVEAVAQLRPDLVFFENVAALLWRGRRAVLEQVLAAFRALGYKTSMNLVHAEAFGVPQLRRRVVVVASRADPIRWPIPAYALVDPARRDSQIGSELTTSPLPVATVSDAIDDLPTLTSSDPDDSVAYRSTPTSSYQQWARGRLGLDQLVPDPCVVETPESVAA